MHGNAKDSAMRSPMHRTCSDIYFDCYNISIHYELNRYVKKVASAHLDEYEAEARRLLPSQ